MKNSRNNGSSRSQKIQATHLSTSFEFSDKQNLILTLWRKNCNLVLNGSAGTGKTFLAFYIALKEVLDKNSEYDSITVIRSVVPTRDQGFLPGTKEEKEEAYMIPYIGICSELFQDNGAWGKLRAQGLVKFESTSFIRGTTYSNTIIIVDEMQNLNFHELDSVITRIGHDSRLIFCGDYHQSDFTNAKEKDGIKSFLKIIEQLEYFPIKSFTSEDIVRSNIVRDYIMAKEKLKI